MTEIGGGKKTLTNEEKKGFNTSVYAVRFLSTEERRKERKKDGSKEIKKPNAFLSPLTVHSVLKF